jgi:hypothetical protein
MSDTNIEVKIPAGNTAAEWNQNIAEGAEKAGVELPKPGAIRITEAPEVDKKDDETIYRSTLKVGDKEMVFEGKDAADVLKQYSAAVEAAQLASAPAPVPAKVEEPKPKFTEAELFDIGLKLQQGNTDALKTFIVKSGLIQEVLESEGIKLSEVKAATTARQSDDLATKWEEATKAFNAKVKAGEIDYPGGDQNYHIMGFMLGALKLTDKPSVESFEQCWAEAKKRGLVFPAAAKAGEVKTDSVIVKDPPSSTAVGSHGGKQDLTQQQGAPTGKVELDTTKLSIREAAESWNELIRRGYKPDQIVVKQS